MMFAFTMPDPVPGSELAGTLCIQTLDHALGVVMQFPSALARPVRE
jgi:hypothetical protein